MLSLCQLQLAWLLTSTACPVLLTIKVLLDVITNAPQPDCIILNAKRQVQMDLNGKQNGCQNGSQNGSQTAVQDSTWYAVTRTTNACAYISLQHGGRQGTSWLAATPTDAQAWELASWLPVASAH